MSAIRTRGLTKRFGDVVAVDGLDLVVEEGEIFGFLGPNGAGKSTTINLLLDFVRPSGGTAEVFGMDAQARSEAIRERIGVLPEGYAHYDHLTGREHVQWVIDTKGVDEDPDHVLELVGIEEAADRAARGYSKGMAQRLAMGMALVGDPDLLILDEPSTGLDPTGKQHMREVIEERAAGGTTVFFSSHVLPDVEAVCDRVGILNEGSLVAMDTIDALREGVGATARIELDCPDLDGGEDLAVEGVVESTFEDGTLTVRCEDPTVKADVVTHVAGRTDVRDVRSSSASLEELFNSYLDDESPEFAGESAGMQGGAS